MLDVTFTVPVPPVGKGRPRVSWSNGEPLVYTPDRTVIFEDDVAWWARQHRPSQRLEGPISVSILAIFPQPKRGLPVGRQWRPRRPDADNVRKGVLDALRDWWRDDAQVVAGETMAIYASETDAPGLVLRIRTLDTNPEAVEAAVVEEFGHV